MDEEEETDPEKLKQLEKQRQKEEKKRQAQKEEDERKYLLRKDLMMKELSYYESVKEQIKSTSDFTAEVLMASMINTEREHFWGCLKLKDEWKDFHCRQLLEDVKGRAIGFDFINHIYLDSFDQIMGSYQEIMLQMMSSFEFRRDRMLKNHWAFLKFAKLKGMEVRDDVRTVSYGTSDRYERKCQILARRQRKQRLRHHNKLLEATAETDYDLETKAFNLWIQFRTVFGRFRKEWKIARRLVFFLKLKDVEDRKIMAKQKKTLDNMDAMKKTDDEIGRKSFWNEKNKELAEERTEYANALNLLQYVLKENMKHDEEKITHLSKVSLHVIKELEKVKEKLEKVLNVKKLCYKLETEEEKVFPSENVEMYRPIIREEFDSAFCMDKLTYRTALVKSHSDHMDNKLQEQINENKRLKNKLKRVLLKLRPNRDVDMAMKNLQSDHN